MDGQEQVAMITVWFGLAGAVFRPGSAIVGIFAWRGLLNANVNEGGVKNKEIKQS
jgi:hypothetical protein